VVGLRAPAAAVDAMSAALGSACEVSSAAFTPGSGAALRLEGFARSVEARSAALLDVLAEACRRTDHHWLEEDESRRFWRKTGAVQSLAEHPVIWRLSVAPSEAPRIVRELEPSAYLLDWGGGLIWLAEPHADAERVRGALAGGHATLFKAPREVRAATPVFQPLPAPLAALTARLKAAFDPADRLNPGRMG
jgi:glycolate oxidase FAD binding subunit